MHLDVGNDVILEYVNMIRAVMETVYDDYTYIYIYIICYTYIYAVMHDLNFVYLG